MAIGLYDLSVANYLQTLGAVAGFMEKAKAKVDTAAIVDAKLAPDMLPFRFQIFSVAHHSLGAINGVKEGLFRPPGQLQPLDFAGLQKVVADTRAGLEKLTPAEVNALEGKDVVFQIGEMKMPFTAEGFLLSFSLPNFYFHATTAYDLLRTNGAPLGKRDYMGQMRMKM